MKLKAWLLSGLVVLSGAAPVFADDEPIPLSTYKVPLTFYVGTAFADAYSTVLFMQYEGKHERNPIIAPWEDNLPLMFTIGGLMEAGAVFAGYHFLGKKHKRLTQILLYGLSAFRGYIAWGNFREVQWLDSIGRTKRGTPYVPPPPYVFVPKPGE